MKLRRGAVDPVTLTVLAAVAAGAWFYPSFKQLFAKKPPIAQVQQADKALEEARAQAKAAQAELDALKAKEEATRAALVRNGQQMVAGAMEAIRRAPDGPEVRLTSSFLSRADVALALANGALSKPEKAEIIAIVDGYLSKVEAERDAAIKALAAKDEELKGVTAERTQLAAKLPVVEAKLDTAQQKAEAAEKTATAKSLELQKWAEAKQAADTAANSFSAQANKLMWWLACLVGAYILIHWILPSLAQEFPNSVVLAKANKAAKAITSAHL